MKSFQRPVKLSEKPPLKIIDPHSHKPQPLKDSDHYLISLRKKHKHPKDRKATISLCSLESKPSLPKALPYKPFRRRKILSLASLDAGSHRTERTLDTSPRQHEKLILKQRASTIENPHNIKRKEHLHYIFESPKHSQIKECVEIVNNVLQNIKENRPQHLPEAPLKATDAKHSKEEKEKKIDYYIRSNNKMSHGKAIIMKMGKSNSLLSIAPKNQFIADSKQLFKCKAEYLPQQREEESFLHFKDSLHLYPEKYQKISKTKNHPTSAIDQSLGQDNEERMKSIECSPIYIASQSSFMSGYSKQELIQQLSENPFLLQAKQAEKGSKRTLKLSNKKIKQAFPTGFFQNHY